MGLIPRRSRRRVCRVSGSLHVQFKRHWWHLSGCEWLNPSGPWWPLAAPQCRTSGDGYLVEHMESLPSLDGRCLQGRRVAFATERPAEADGMRLGALVPPLERLSCSSRLSTAVASPRPTIWLRRQSPSANGGSERSGTVAGVARRRLNVVFFSRRSLSCEENNKSSDEKQPDLHRRRVSAISWRTQLQPPPLSLLLLGCRGKLAAAAAWFHGNKQEANQQPVMALESRVERPSGKDGKMRDRNQLDKNLCSYRETGRSLLIGCCCFLLILML